MTTLLDNLTSPLTVNEIRTAIYAAIEARGTSTATWKPGAMARTIIAGVSIVLAAFSVLIALIAKSGFLTLSEGDWLTLTARYQYDTDRIQATYAAGYVTADNAGGNVYYLDVGDLVFANSATGATYRNTEAVTIGSLEMGVVIPVVAQDIGSAGNAAAGAIDTLVTSLLGVTVSNAATLRGTDAETDADLRVRAMERVGSLSPNGPNDAYFYAAKSARRSDGAPVGVTRVNVTPDGMGGVSVVVAGASGAITGDAEDPETDLGAVAAAINANACPGNGITATTTSATGLTVNYEGTVWVSDDAPHTDDEIKAAAQARVAALLSTTPIGGVVIGTAPGKLYLQRIEDALAADIGADLVNLETVAPAGDVDLSGDDYATALGTFDLTVVRVAST